jgi:Fe-S cluster assembly protein SufD
MRVAEAQDLYLTQFDELTRAQAASDPAWLREQRRGAIARFRSQGFPTTRDEEFRATPVAAIADRAFEPTFDGAGSAAGAGAHVAVTSLSASVREQFTIPELTTAADLIFVNGRFAPELSSARPLPKGVRVTSLAAALTIEPTLVEPYLSRTIKFETQGFTALNTAFVQDGAVVFLPDNAVLTEPIHLVFVSQPEPGKPFVSHPRTLIVAGRNSQGRVIESFVGTQVYFTNAVTEIVGGENSHLDHYRVQRESLDAYHVSSTHLQLARSATLTSHSLALGGQLVRNDVNAVLDAEGIVCTLNGLYLVDGRRLVDNHTTIDHAKPHCESHELYKGVIDDHGRGVFNGKILVRQDAQKTDAKQTNQVLLLSEDATINTKPQLEIFADDVKCTHGATVGQLAEEQMFYLRARGIGLNEAQAMLIHAFASDIVERIEIEPLRDQLEQYLLSRLPIEA